MIIRLCTGIAIENLSSTSPESSDRQRTDELLKAADVALAEAKSFGSGAIRLYSPELDDRIRNKVVLEQGLHTALSDQQFDLHFQPIVDLQTLKIVGAESLIRWQHPVLGLQRPDQFIPLAEATGQIVPLGQWVLEEALRKLRNWEEFGGFVPRLSINVSGVQLRHPSFFDSAVAAIRDSGVDPRRLELELTETAMVDCTPEILDKLTRLRDLGLTIALDDFGTGYSSFRYLHNLPIDKIKIDQSFVRRMVVNSSDAAIIRGIISIARDLSLRVVVEGIENEEQRTFLAQAGAELGQGYLFSLPLLEDDFVWMFRNGVTLPLICDQADTRSEPA